MNAAEYSERVTAFLSRNSENSEGQWRTINGAHVFIENGRITKGPSHMVGKTEAGAGASGDQKKSAQTLHDRAKSGELSWTQAAKQAKKEGDEVHKHFIAIKASERNAMFHRSPESIAKERQDKEDLDRRAKEMAENDETVMATVPGMQSTYYEEKGEDWLDMPKEDRAAVIAKDKKKWEADQAEEDHKKYLEQEEERESLRAWEANRAEADEIENRVLDAIGVKDRSFHKASSGSRYLEHRGLKLRISNHYQVDGGGFNPVTGERMGESDIEWIVGRGHDMPSKEEIRQHVAKAIKKNVRGWRTNLSAAEYKSRVTDRIVELAEKSAVVLIDVDQIDFVRGDVSVKTKDDRAARIADKIKSGGDVPPIQITPKKGGRFFVVDGNARLTAFRMLGRKQIPALIIQDREDARAAKQASVDKHFEDGKIGLLSAAAYRDKIDRVLPRDVITLSAVELKPEADSDTQTYRYWTDALRPGKWHHANGVLYMTVDRMDRIAKATKLALSRNVEIPIVLDHNESAAATKGYIRDVKRDGDTLMVLHEFIGSDAKNIALKNKVSLGLDPRFKDSLGNHYGEAIRHSALTPRPVITGQRGFVPEQAAGTSVLQPAA